MHTLTNADERARRASYGVLAAAVLARALLAALAPLAPDESYYWQWSRHLAAGYLDHPFGIALLVRPGTALIGATAFGVRAGSLLAGAAASLVIVRLASTLGGARAMLRAAWIIACMPLAGIGLALATPDAPLLLAWSLALLALTAALAPGATRAAAMRGWLLAGAALGLAMDAKYTAILLVPGVAISLVAHRTLRRSLATWGPYAALVVALVAFSPNLLWNATHGWATVGYGLARGLDAHRGSALVHEAALFGGQLALVSPLLLAMLAVAAWRAARQRADSVRAMLGIVAVVTWLAFVASALRSAVEPNWQAPAYLSAIALAASTDGGVRWRRALRAAVVVGLVLTVGISVQALAPFLPISASLDPTAAGAGWDALADRVRAARAAVPATVTAWVAGERYQEASELAFHLPDRPPTFVIDVRARPTEYDRWPSFAARAHRGDALVLVLGTFRSPSADPVIAALAPHFDRVTLREVVALRRGQSVKAWRRVWLLEGWRGTWPSAALAR
jgi:4-amino-4-deoxy-L-arabinose transferase-like glycosyltransferase